MLSVQDEVGMSFAPGAPVSACRRVYGQAADLHAPVAVRPSLRRYGAVTSGPLTLLADLPSAMNVTQGAQSRTQLARVNSYSMYGAESFFRGEPGPGF